MYKITALQTANFKKLYKTQLNKHKSNIDTYGDYTKNKNIFV